jgi:hypothetical protein
MEVNMLKKIVLTLAIVAFSANVFAYNTTPTAACLSNGTWPTVITFVPSKSVVLGYHSGLPTGVSAGNNSLYSIGSKNKAGDLIFATTSASTAIVKAAGQTGADLATTDIPNLPGTTTDSAITGGANNWTIM